MPIAIIGARVCRHLAMRAAEARSALADIGVHVAPAVASASADAALLLQAAGGARKPRATETLPVSAYAVTRTVWVRAQELGATVRPCPAGITGASAARARAGSVPAATALISTTRATPASEAEARARDAIAMATTAQRAEVLAGVPGPVALALAHPSGALSVPAAVPDATANDAGVHGGETGRGIPRPKRQRRGHMQR